MFISPFTLTAGKWARRCPDTNRYQPSDFSLQVNFATHSQYFISNSMQSHRVPMATLLPNGHILTRIRIKSGKAQTNLPFTLSPSSLTVALEVDESIFKKFLPLSHFNCLGTATPLPVTHTTTNFLPNRNSQVGFMRRLEKVVLPCIRITWEWLNPCPNTTEP